MWPPPVLPSCALFALLFVARLLYLTVSNGGKLGDVIALNILVITLIVEAVILYVGTRNYEESDWKRRKDAHDDLIAAENHRKSQTRRVQEVGR